MALGRPAWREARERVKELLSKECTILKNSKDLLSRFVFISINLKKYLLRFYLNTK